MMWWFAEQTTDEELSKGHAFGCSTLSCEYTQTVQAEDVGKIILIANARDDAYGTLLGEAHQASEGRGMACATLEIIED